jgi:hypothetical protein
MRICIAGSEKAFWRRDFQRAERFQVASGGSQFQSAQALSVHDLSDLECPERFHDLQREREGRIGDFCRRTGKNSIFLLFTIDSKIERQKSEKREIEAGKFIVFDNTRELEKSVIQIDFSIDFFLMAGFEILPQGKIENRVLAGYLEIIKEYTELGLAMNFEAFSAVRTLTVPAEEARDDAIIGSAFLLKKFRECQETQPCF